jgi:hypothetical protein
MFRRLLHRLGLRFSPSVAMEDAGRDLIAIWTSGIERAERETAGMTPEERIRYAVASLSPEAVAYADGVARRSFPALYDGED